MRLVEYANLYKCLCDEQRVRILNLLDAGPLCVCHLVEVLDADQVKVSKQLRYMKELGVVEGERQAQWMVYRLLESDDHLLSSNLRILRDQPDLKSLFESDARKRIETIRRIKESNTTCVSSVVG